MTKTGQQFLKTNYSNIRAWSSNKFEITAFFMQSYWLECLLWLLIGLKERQFQTFGKITLRNKNSLSLHVLKLPTCFEYQIQIVTQIYKNLHRLEPWLTDDISRTCFPKWFKWCREPLPPPLGFLQDTWNQLFLTFDFHVVTLSYKLLYLIWLLIWVLCNKVWANRRQLQNCSLEIFFFF